MISLTDVLNHKFKVKQYYHCQVVDSGFYSMLLGSSHFSKYTFYVGFNLKVNEPHFLEYNRHVGCTLTSTQDEYVQ
jgi:hypothetical protein